MANFSKTKRLFMLLLAVAGSGLFSEAQSGTKGHVIHTYPLDSDLIGKVYANGCFEFSSPDGTWSPLRNTFIPTPVNHRGRLREKALKPFQSLVAEGVTAGQRGFSAQADDDNDGNIDEDRLDGIDNDNDGYIDEDFAAIGEAMVAITTGGSGDSAHFEYYNWPYPYLKSAVFATISNSDVSENSSEISAGVWEIATTGTSWQEAEISGVCHSIAGRQQHKNSIAFVSQVNLPFGSYVNPLDHSNPVDAHISSPNTHMWVGVMVLAPDSRAVVDGSSLGLELTNQPQSLVMCYAKSWLQLNSLLLKAADIYKGVVDPVDARQARWIVSPLCSLCRMAETAKFSWEIDNFGDLFLRANIDSGISGLLDPDMFIFNGYYLGSPEEIAWLPESGPRLTTEWSSMTAGHLNRFYRHLSNPYGKMEDLLGHESKGELTFRFQLSKALRDRVFVNVGSSSELSLLGHYLDGRPINTFAEVDSRQGDQDTKYSSFATEQPEQNNNNTGDVSSVFDRNNQPRLSPDLLENYPNPFADFTRISFKVPESVGEAFVWGKDKTPENIDMMAAVPWEHDSPNITIKIYSIDGMELRTLYSQNLPSGGFSTQWDGADASGRPVASGTYFCKLQMDSWSVTRRLIFLR